MRQHTRNAVGFVVLAILMAALFYWNINTGSVHLSLERMLTLLRWGNDGTTEGNYYCVLIPHYPANDAPDLHTTH